MKRIILVVITVISLIFSPLINAPVRAQTTDKVVFISGDTYGYNGTYEYQGTRNSHPYYKLIGQPIYLYVDNYGGYWTCWVLGLLASNPDDTSIKYYQYTDPTPASNPGDPQWYDTTTECSGGNCERDVIITDAASGVAPTVTTDQASLVTTTSGTMNGNIVADGGATTYRGFVYSTSDNTPTIGESGVTQVAVGTGTGIFSNLLGSLIAGGTYYYQAYGSNTYGTTYGGVLSFTTPTTSQPNKYVSGITNPAAANGVYVWIGEYYGKPAWKHQTQNYWVYYSRYGSAYPSDYYWYIDDALTNEHGANDYLFNHTDAATCPTSGWVVEDGTGTPSVVDYPQVDFIDGSTFFPGSPTAGSNNNPIGRFYLDADTTGASLTAVTVTTGGSRSGVSNLKLWSSTDATFNSGSDTQLNSQSDGSSVTFSGFSSAISASVTYYFVTTDLGVSASGSFVPTIGSISNLTISGGASSTGINNAPLSSGEITILSYPTITGVSSSLADGSYTTGSTIPITVTFSKVVNVTGTPQITLETGTTDRVVDYSGGGGTTALTFDYTVQAGDTSGDLDYTGTTALALNTGTIRDTDSNGAILTLPVPGAAGSLGANKNIVIDTTSPTITINNPNTDPATSKTITAGTSEGTLSMSNTTDSTCDGSLTFIAYASQTFTSDADNGTRVCYHAVDAASNTSYNLSDAIAGIDSTAPNTTINTNPANPTDSTSASFTFSGTDNTGGSGVDHYECNLDGGVFSTCSSPRDYSGLSDGSHTFQVWSIDAAGNTDPTPASYTWTVDTTAPDTTITSNPTNPTNSTSASFAFSGNDGSGSGVAGFECRLDGGSFDTCTSPRDYTSLSEASHTFQVQAIDNAGNVDGTPASYTWVVDTTAPTVTISSSATDPTGTSPIPVTIQFSEEVTGFIAPDITPINGTVNSFTEVDFDTYTFDLVPASQGTVTVDVAAGVAVDAAGNGNTAAAQFSIVYGSAPAITSADNVTFEVGTSGSFTVTTTGYPARTITRGGDTLPAGISFTDNGDGTGTLTGTPAAGMGGIYDLTFTASNGITPSASQNFTLTINEAPTITSANSAGFTVGAAGSFTVTSTGHPSATVSMTGALPSGVTFVDNGNGTGTLSGTPAAGTGGSYPITITANNTISPNATQNFSLTVDQAPAITSANNVTFVVGLVSSFTVTTTGFPDPAITRSGDALPAGITLTDNGDGTGTLGGTPALGTVGTYDLSFTAANGITPDATQDFTFSVNGPPAVSLINSVADTGDGQVDENEHTSTAITQLLVEFNKDMNQGDATALEHYQLMLNGTTGISIDGVTYSLPTQTATLSINSGVALPNGRYTLTVSGAIRDTLGAPISGDFIRHFYIDTGNPATASVVTVQNDSTITAGAVINSRFSSIQVTFSEDVSNTGSGAGVDDVSNPFNYLLLQAGPNGAFDTGTCQAFATNGSLPLGDDIYISTGPVSYDNNGGAGPFVATVQLNNGTSLANGSYRLHICGTTSIIDLAGNPLNGGADTILDFSVLVRSTVRSNPSTGFEPGVMTVLPEQPAEEAYSDLGSLWIEIPGLGVETSITGVLLEKDGWDVTWLHDQVGWLEGTAYPTWEGNTVLTAHAFTSDGLPGPFAMLKELKYGDTFVIHLNGRAYTYSVKGNTLVSPTDTRLLTKHEQLDWVTLITCQQYDEKSHGYLYRRVVRAVLIEVK